jgi:hypothetical protein
MKKNGLEHWRFPPNAAYYLQGSLPRSGQIAKPGAGGVFYRLPRLRRQVRSTLKGLRILIKYLDFGVDANAWLPMVGLRFSQAHHGLWNAALPEQRIGIAVKHNSM